MPATMRLALLLPIMVQTLVAGYSPTDAELISAFERTGCSGGTIPQRVFDYWKTSEETALTDMKGYCDLVVAGTAHDGQRTTCCGSCSTPPTACTQQAAVIPGASCDTFTCPSGYSTKPGATCASDPCVEATDSGTCCVCEIGPYGVADVLSEFATNPLEIEAVNALRPLKNVATALAGASVTSFYPPKRARDGLSSAAPIPDGWGEVANLLDGIQLDSGFHSWLPLMQGNAKQTVTVKLAKPYTVSYVGWLSGSEPESFAKGAQLVLSNSVAGGCSTFAYEPLTYTSGVTYLKDNTRYKLFRIPDEKQNAINTIAFEFELLNPTCSPQDRADLKMVSVEAWASTSETFANDTNPIMTPWEPSTKANWTNFKCETVQDGFQKVSTENDVDAFVSSLPRNTAENCVFSSSRGHWLGFKTASRGLCAISGAVPYADRANHEVASYSQTDSAGSRGLYKPLMNIIQKFADDNSLPGVDSPFFAAWGGQTVVKAWCKMVKWTSCQVPASKTTSETGLAMASSCATAKKCVCEYTAGGVHYPCWTKMPEFSERCEAMCGTH